MKAGTIPSGTVQSPKGYVPKATQLQQEQSSSKWESDQRLALFHRNSPTPERIRTEGQRSTLRKFKPYSISWIKPGELKMQSLQTLKPRRKLTLQLWGQQDSWELSELCGCMFAHHTQSCVRGLLRIPLLITK